MRGSLKFASHLLLAMTVALTLTVSVAGGQKHRTVLSVSDPCDSSIPSAVTIYDDHTNMRFSIVLNTYAQNFGEWAMYDPETGELHSGMATSVIFIAGGRVKVQQSAEATDEAMLMNANIVYRRIRNDGVECPRGAMGTAVVACVDPHIMMHVHDTVPSR